MSDWISVEDRLPEFDVPVLVTPKAWPDAVWSAMLFDEDDGYLWAQYTFGPLNDKGSYECDDDYQYTLWMPLPEPPEATP
jgi:hypothetical protein